MTEDKKKIIKGGSIKDRILSDSKSGQVKKKILIKKKPVTTNKNITDLFTKEKSAPSVKRKPEIEPPKAGETQTTSQTPTQQIKRTPPVSSPPSVRKADAPGDRGRKPSSPPPQRPPMSRSTPFDTAAREGVVTKRPGDAGYAGKKPPARKGEAGAPPYGHSSRKKNQERENSSKFFHQVDKRKKKTTAKGTTVPAQIEIMESIQVGELAKKLNIRPGDIIAKLMKMGEMVTINKIIDSDTATMVASEYNCEVKVVSLFDETVIEDEDDVSQDRINRPPVVTIMGHVDHGKTKLLDTIRKSNVAETESGAITQHIGAYQVVTPRGKITFLDTPGHEAFTAMRARGAAVTDIVVLVVAADDGVKEQTVEALNHALEAKVPIIVAINKIDLEGANPERVKQELSQHGLLVEGWGGSSIVCEISAKQNIGIEALLEAILLQSEVLELGANAKLRAVGCVIEARVDPGKGPVATVLIQKGTLREGDPYVVGIYAGRVRAMFDDLGRRIHEAGPSVPVEILGIDGVPSAGDPFQVVESEKYGREVASKRKHYQQVTDAAGRAQPVVDDLKSWMKLHDRTAQELRVIVKTDVQGSAEAIKDTLMKLAFEDIAVKVIHTATGAITESDLDLARASDAIIVGFHIRPNPRIQELAEQYRVKMEFFDIIYAINDYMRKYLEGMLEPEIVEEVTGQAEIREIFKISRIGIVAGCMVTSGKILRNNPVRVKRNKEFIYTGKIKALKRHKDDASEVAEGFECGMSLDGFNDLKIGDIFESFELKKIPRKLK